MQQILNVNGDEWLILKQEYGTGHLQLSSADSRGVTDTAFSTR
jgi:hypothetical protein